MVPLYVNASKTTRILKMKKRNQQQTNDELDNMGINATSGYPGLEED